MSEKVIASVVAEIAQSLEISASYNQIWVLRPHIDHEGNKTLAVVDERNDKIKYVFYNPDDAMKEVIDIVTEIGWIATKQKYLTNHSFKVTIVEN